MQAKRLVDLYADMILRISYSYLKQTYDAEDICQTVFLKILTKDLRFDSPEQEKAWIIRATINACKDHLRSAFYRRSVPLEAAETVAAPQVPKSHVMEALQTLPDKYRVVLYLYYYEEFSTKEIGTILKKSESAISARLSRGRRMLRTYLETEGA